MREGSLPSQDQVRPTFLRDGLQQGILQQRQLCPRPCRPRTDPGYLRHRHGTGQCGSVLVSGLVVVVVSPQTESIGRVKCG